MLSLVVLVMRLNVDWICRVGSGSPKAASPSSVTQMSRLPCEMNCCHSMAAIKSKISVPAPSPTLLRFLRSQSEGVFFFSPNLRHRTFVFDHAAPRDCQPRMKPDLKLLKPAIKAFSTNARTAAPIEAGLLNLDFLWPRASEIPLPKSRIPNRGATLPGGSYLSQQRRRNASQGWLWRRLSGGYDKLQKQRPLMPDDLPGNRGGDEGVESMFPLGRTMSAKAANEPKLRCTEFDENGNVVLVNGEFKKSELIAKVWHGVLVCSLSTC